MDLLLSKWVMLLLLATVVSSRTKSPVDFLPLTVDYREKFAAIGKFPGGFFKREV